MLERDVSLTLLLHVHGAQTARLYLNLRDDRLVERPHELPNVRLEVQRRRKSATQIPQLLLRRGHTIVEEDGRCVQPT